MHWTLPTLRSLSRNEYDVLVDYLHAQQQTPDDVDVELPLADAVSYGR